MKKLVIATHGYMAKGIKNSLGIISGDTSDIIDINGFTEDCPNPEEAVQKLFEQYRDEDIAVLTDVYFGGINQIFLRAYREHTFLLATGINLPLAMELHHHIGEELTEAQFNEIVNLGRNEMKAVERRIISTYSISDDEEEL